MSAGRIANRSKNHTVGVVDGLVVTYVFKGGAEDPHHIMATAEALLAETKRTGEPVRVLFVIAEPSMSNPPSGAVRDALLAWGRRYEQSMSLVVVAIPADGVGGAVHRTVVRTLFALLRLKVPHVIAETVKEGLTHVGLSGGALEGVLRFCEVDLARPAVS